MVRPHRDNTPVLGRQMPHSIEAEEYALSCALLDGRNSFTKAINMGVRADTFYVEANRLLWAELSAMHASGVDFALEIVIERLNTSGKLEEVGGMPHLLGVSSRIPTTAQDELFYESILEHEQLRNAIKAGTHIVELAYDYSGGGVAEHLGKAVEAANEAIQARQKVRDWKQVVDEAKAITQARMNPGEEGIAAWSLDWAWSNLNHAFQPMEPGEMIVVGARPSVGKSSLARQQSYFTASHGHPTLLSSLEVTDTELAINLAANLSRVGSRRGVDQLPPDKAADLLASFDQMRKLGSFTVSHTDDWLAELLGRAAAFKARHGLDLWVIDYLQLIGDCTRFERNESQPIAIGRVTRALKRFASREKCVVMLLAQLNREVEKRTDTEPQLIDLKSSGDIEQDATRVVFLHRPDKIPGQFTITGAEEDQDPNDERAWHYVRAIQAKGRNHGTAVASLRFDRATATFNRFSR